MQTESERIHDILQRTWAREISADEALDEIEEETAAPDDKIVQASGFSVQFGSYDYLLVAVTQGGRVLMSVGDGGWSDVGPKAAAPEPTAPGGYALIRQDLVDFLHGLSELKGVNFGELPDDERGKYWWRKFLPPFTRNSNGETP